MFVTKQNFSYTCNICKCNCPINTAVLRTNISELAFSNISEFISNAFVYAVLIMQISRRMVRAQTMWIKSIYTKVMSICRGQKSRRNSELTRLVYKNVYIHMFYCELWDQRSLLRLLFKIWYIKNVSILAWARSNSLRDVQDDLFLNINSGSCFTCNVF